MQNKQWAGGSKQKDKQWAGGSKQKGRSKIAAALECGLAAYCNVIRWDWYLDGLAAYCNVIRWDSYVALEI